MIPELHPSGTENEGDSLGRPSGICLKPNGLWCQWQDLSTPKMELYGVANNSLGTLTTALDHNEPEKYGDSEI